MLFYHSHSCQCSRPKTTTAIVGRSFFFSTCTSFHFHFQVVQQWREWSMRLGKFSRDFVQNVVVFTEPQQPKVSDFVPQQNEKNLWLLGVNISVFRAGKPILSLSILTCQRISNSGVAGSLWYLSWNHRQADDQKIGNVQAGRGCWEVPKVSQTPKS